MTEKKITELDTKDKKPTHPDLVNIPVPNVPYEEAIIIGEKLIKNLDRYISIVDDALGKKNANN